MARINLLPWRQEQREKRNNEFNILIVGTIVLAAICTFIGYSVLNNTLNNQRDANKRVEDANAQLEAKLNTITNESNSRFARPTLHSCACMGRYGACCT